MTGPATAQTSADRSNLWLAALHSLESGIITRDAVFCAAYLLTKPDHWPTRGMVISGLSALEPMRIDSDPQKPFEPLLLHWDGWSFSALDSLGGELQPQPAPDGLRNLVQAVWQGLEASACMALAPHCLPAWREHAVNTLIAQMVALSRELPAQFLPDDEIGGDRPPLPAARDSEQSVAPGIDTLGVSTRQTASRPALPTMVDSDTGSAVSATSAMNSAGAMNSASAMSTMSAVSTVSVANLANVRFPMADRQSPAVDPRPARTRRAMTADDILLVQKECVSSSGYDRQKARRIAKERHFDFSRLRYYMEQNGKLKEAGERKIAAAILISLDPRLKETGPVNRPSFKPPGQQ